MGWRFRRSLRIAPGIRLNLGSRGMTSLSLGGRGVTVNLSKRGTKTTYGLPGTGLSYQTRTTPLPTPRRAVAGASHPNNGHLPQARSRLCRSRRRGLPLFSRLAPKSCLAGAPPAGRDGRTATATASDRCTRPVALGWHSVFDHSSSHGGRDQATP